jgi:hypothetical protein
MWMYHPLLQRKRQPDIASPNPVLFPVFPEGSPGIPGTYLHRRKKYVMGVEVQTAVTPKNLHYIECILRAFFVLRFPP